MGGLLSLFGVCSFKVVKCNLHLECHHIHFGFKFHKHTYQISEKLLFLSILKGIKSPDERYKKKTPEAWKLDADRGNASSSTVHYLSFALTSCSKSVSVGFFQTLLSSNVVRNLCISACTYFGSAAQTRLFFDDCMQFLANVQQLTVSGFVIFAPPPPPRPYIHDCLGMVPQTRQAESGLQASHRPGETLQHGRGSPEAQAATLHLIELGALREHLEGVLEETVEVWIRILPARRWALSGRPPRHDSQLL